MTSTGPRVALSPFPTKDSIYLFFFTQGHSVTVPGVACGILKADKLTDTVYAVVRLTACPPATLTLTSIGRHLQCDQHFVPSAGRVCVWHWVPDRDTIHHHPERLRHLHSHKWEANQQLWPQQLQLQCQLHLLLACAKWLLWSAIECRLLHHFGHPNLQDT